MSQIVAEGHQYILDAAVPEGATPDPHMDAEFQSFGLSQLSESKKDAVAVWDHSGIVAVGALKHEFGRSIGEVRVDPRLNGTTKAVAKLIGRALRQTAELRGFPETDLDIQTAPPLEEREVHMEALLRPVRERREARMRQRRIGELTRRHAGMIDGPTSPIEEWYALNDFPMSEL